MLLQRLLVGLAAIVFHAAAYAQEPTPKHAGMPGMADMNMGASNDLFVMAGSDFDRPGLLPRAN